jgi:hypothetical protein
LWINFAHDLSLVKQETRQQCGELSLVHHHLLDDILEQLKTYHDLRKDEQVSIIKTERVMYMLIASGTVQAQVEAQAPTMSAEGYKPLSWRVMLE